MPADLEITEDITHADPMNFLDAQKTAKSMCAPAMNESFEDYIGRMSPDSFKWTVIKDSVYEALQLDRELIGYLEERPMPTDEWKCYALNERINDRGVAVDDKFVESAIACDRLYRKEYLELFKKITDCDYLCPGEFQGWLAEHGVETESLSQSVLNRYRPSANPDVQVAISLWRYLTMTSTQKYYAIDKAYCNDGRLHGLYSFCGGRNGRFGNSIFQTDNLPVSRLSALEEMRALIRSGKHGNLDTHCSSVADVMCELLATSFVPASGCSLYVLEYTGLESSVLHWLGKLGVCDGYVEGIDESVSDFMLAIGLALAACFEEERPSSTFGIRFIPTSCDLHVQLPSGRSLIYYNVVPEGHEADGFPVFLYDGIGEKGRWRCIRETVAKLICDVVQGIARDVLVFAMNSLEENGFHIVMHHPGTLLIESSEKNLMGQICDVFRCTPPWADKLNLSIRGYRCEKYYERSMDTTRKA